MPDDATQDIEGQTRQVLGMIDALLARTGTDKTHATILTPDMIAPGMHVNAVGADCPSKTELHPDVLRGARVFVEYAPQTRIEGDIQQLPRVAAPRDLNHACAPRGRTGTRRPQNRCRRWVLLTSSITA